MLRLWGSPVNHNPGCNWFSLLCSSSHSDICSEPTERSRSFPWGGSEGGENVASLIQLREHMDTFGTTFPAFVADTTSVDKAHSAAVALGLLEGCTTVSACCSGSAQKKWNSAHAFLKILAGEKSADYYTAEKSKKLYGIYHGSDAKKTQFFNDVKGRLESCGDNPTKTCLGR